MLTYLYIALGGAIGSVARAWTTSVMMRLAGQHFPWGTILINVVGSFIIGFFATLTASDGRFQVHADARAFIMVGICGGYTTFSSFSLQTLDLLRDGKPGAALANIALSVILCLAAVTAGYASAMAVNAMPARAGAAKTAVAAPQKKAPGKTVLAVLDSPETVSSVLSSAARLLEFGNGGRIEALAIRTPPVPAIVIADQALSPAEEERLHNQEEDWAAAVKALTRQWANRAKDKAVLIDFADAEGDAAHLAAEHGRHSDAIVLPGGRPQSHQGRDAIHAAISGTSRPVLIAPRHGAGEFGRVVAIAWKDGVRAQKAVLAAMPILRQAEAVHVLCAHVQEAVVPSILEEHGVVAEAHTVEGDGPVGAQLLHMAHALGADMIVMGAYVHGEWREAVLGGVTRYMLDHAGLPLFMVH